ncbi:MAG TPA: hypothetical protein VK625_15310, partial [Flavitalea sp.]|nr:hypothetical protein [Flavitalea sp.]
DKLIRKGNAETAIKDFTLQTVYGNDTTQAILDKPGYSLLLFVQNNYKKGPWTETLESVMTMASRKKIEGFLVTNISIDALRADRPEAFTVFTPLLCDATAIKTAARNNPTLYLLKQGIIINKWSYADLDRALLQIQQLPVP